MTITDTIDITGISPELQEKLVSKVKNYKACTEFSKLLYLFKSTIIREGITGECYYTLADRYKQTYFAWGINWQVTKGVNHPENLPMPRGLINVYINCFSMFGDEVYNETNASINELAKVVNCYYYDELNSSFYFLPEQLENGLKFINDWYVKTKGSIEGILKQKKIAKLQAELAGLTESVV
jgi:hypothetical protein